jgi:hypothetical protein
MAVVKEQERTLPPTISNLEEVKGKGELVPVKEGDQVIDLETFPETLPERLERLGFTQVTKKIDLAKKLAIAYAKYGFVSEEKITLFNKRLKEETLNEDARAASYKKLIFIDLKDYPEAPPVHVLNALENAVTDGIFDRFEIAKIDWIREVKDPIIFGRIKGCTDRFFIAQWDDDVRIEDIIGV